jgi:hypothetical protein
MRKALIGILLAASASLPAAWAAPDDSEVRTPRQERAVQRTQRVEQRQQRQEVRQQARQDVARPRIQQPDRRQDSGQAAGTQGRGGWSGRGGDQSGQGWNRDRTPNSSGGGQWRGNQNDPRSQRYRRPDGQVDGSQRNWEHDRRGDNRGGTWNRDDDRRRGDWNRDNDGRRGDWNRDNDRRRDWNGHRRWDRNGWRSDRRYNWQGWRNSNRHLYRNPGYYAPYRHYRYSRLSIGIVLDRLFWGQNYWIGDPWQYRLPDPGPGFTWVRYYNDVLLIDTYSGEVVDVIYDFFW